MTRWLTGEELMPFVDPSYANALPPLGPKAHQGHPDIKWEASYAPDHQVHPPSPTYRQIQWTHGDAATQDEQHAASHICQRFFILPCSVPGGD